MKSGALAVIALFSVAMILTGVLQWGEWTYIGENLLLIGSGGFFLLWSVWFWKRRK